MYQRIGRLFLKVWPVGTALALIAGMAIASIPDSQGVIHGCYKPSKANALRVIDPGLNQRCKPGEVALDWNRTGPPGAPGSPGPAGGSQITEHITVTNTSEPARNALQESYQWTQPAGQIDEFLVSSPVTVSVPEGCGGVVVDGVTANINAGPSEVTGSNHAFWLGSVQLEEPFVARTVEVPVHPYDSSEATVMAPDSSASRQLFLNVRVAAYCTHSDGIPRVESVTFTHVVIH